VAAEVAHQLVGGDDGLGLEHGAGRGRFDQRVQRLDQQVGLGQVEAAGARALAHERDGVHPDDLDAAVGQEQDGVEHGGEDPRVGVVEVPLVVEERGPHPAVGLGREGERAGCGVREHVGDRGLDRVRPGPVRVAQVEAGVRGVPGQPGLRPRVLAGGVVEHQVHAQADAARPERTGQLRQLVHRAQARVHLPVVGHRVAAVVGALARGQQRHQVQVGHAQLGQVVQPVVQPGQGPGEAVGVGDVAEHAGLLEPVGHGLPAAVELTQLGGPLGGGAQHNVEQFGQVDVLAVELVERGVRVEEPGVHPGQERGRVAAGQPVAGGDGQPRTQQRQRVGGPPAAFPVGPTRDHRRILAAGGSGRHRHQQDGRQPGGRGADDLEQLGAAVRSAGVVTTAHGRSRSGGLCRHLRPDRSRRMHRAPGSPVRGRR
jgi:hypothetical protein